MPAGSRNIALATGALALAIVVVWLALRAESGGGPEAVRSLPGTKRENDERSRAGASYEGIRPEPSSRQPSSEAFTVDEREPPIRGIVVDRLDRPVAMASVALHAEAVDDGFSRTARRETSAESTETSEDGRFSFFECDRGTPYSVLVRAAGFAANHTRGVAAGTDLRVVLDPGTTISGRVVAARDDSAIAGARLTLRGVTPDDSDSAGDDTLAGEATSGANGEFSFSRVPRGLVRVDAEAPGYAPSSRVAWTDEGEDGVPAAPIELRLDDGLPLSGVVLDGDSGLPVPHATVEASCQHLNESLVPLVRATRTDESGRFRFEDLRRRSFEVPRPYSRAGAASYELTATAPGDREGRVRVDLAGLDDAEPAPLVIRLSRLDRARVRVSVVDYDDESPVEGATVILNGVCRLDGRLVSDRLVTGADGTTVFDGIDRDLSLTVRARKPGFVTAVERPRNEPGTDGDIELTCRLSRASARLRVAVRWGDGEPVASARVFLVIADPVTEDPAWDGQRSLSHRYPVFDHPIHEGGFADADGRFVTDSLGPGRYVMEVDHPDACDGKVVLVDLGPTTLETPIVLVRGDRIAGTVWLEDGTPVDRVLVVAGPIADLSTAPRRAVRFARTDRAGRFDVRGIDPTIPYRVCVNTRFSIGGTGLDDRTRIVRDGVMAGEVVHFRLVPIADLVR